jgi:hypothetical protein
MVGSDKQVTYANEEVKRRSKMENILIREYTRLMTIVYSIAAEPKR